jgi:hypothetical protein
MASVVQAWRLLTWLLLLSCYISQSLLVWGQTLLRTERCEPPVPQTASPVVVAQLGRVKELDALDTTRYERQPGQESTLIYNEEEVLDRIVLTLYFDRDSADEVVVLLDDSTSSRLSADQVRAIVSGSECKQETGGGGTNLRVCPLRGDWIEANWTVPFKICTKTVQIVLRGGSHFSLHLI